MSNQLTDRQQNVYEMIRGLIVKRGYGPTVREIGEHFGIKSPNGVMCHLRALERKGLITRSPNKSRAIELTDGASRNAHAMPISGIVGAGFTMLDLDQNERIDLGDVLFKEDRYVLRVSGDSLIDAHITDGDYVVIQKTDHAESGKLVIAQVGDGKATLKYWFPENGRIRLQPANASMEPTYVSDAQVIGVAVGVVRSSV
jgi:repressor LexA